jgi:hypothetical protein
MSILGGQIRKSTCTEDGQTNANTRQYRNKIVCVGCTERTIVVSFVILLFVYAV